MSNALALVSQDIYDTRSAFDAVLTDKSLSFEREAGFAIQILQNSEYALGLAMNNRQSVVNAVTNIAAIGISLNPAKKQAYLVPRDKKICLDISYIGLLDLAVASNSIRWGQAELVHKGDSFQLNGFDKPPTHGRDPFSSDRGEIVGAYVVVKTHDGDYLTTTMGIAEIYAIRDRSESFKSGKKSPCKTDPGEMIKKTVIKRAFKMWPKTDRLDHAVEYLNTDGGEGINFDSKPVTDPEILPRLRQMVDQAETADQLKKIWEEGLKAVKPTGDLTLYNAFKDAVATRGATIRDREMSPETPPDDGNTIDEHQPGQPETAWEEQ